jgi:hypothetical protein
VTNGSKFKVLDRARSGCNLGDYSLTEARSAANAEPVNNAERVQNQCDLAGSALNRLCDLGAKADSSRVFVGLLGSYPQNHRHRVVATDTEVVVEREGGVEI